MASLDSGTVRLDIPSRIHMLEAADLLVSHLATAAGFDQDSRQDIRAAVHESVMNAILHGNRKDGRRRVKIDVVVHPGALEVRVQDEGRGFDPNTVPNPIVRENLMKSSGRGIFLMRALMDDVSFLRPANGGTQVRMLKLLLPTAQRQGADRARFTPSPDAPRPRRHRILGFSGRSSSTRGRAGSV
jgi:serine/threonine-protein kinase RsbW